MEESQPAALVAARYRLAILVARARWVSIVFELVETFLAQPPPISRPGLLAGLVISAAYNIPAMRPERFSSRALERFLAIALILDFLIIGNAVALSANAPADNGYLLWVLPGLEAALLYRWAGAIVFSCGFLIGFTVFVAVRHTYFADATEPGSYIFGAVTMIFVAMFSGGMAAVAHRPARAATLRAEQVASQAAELERLYAEAQEAHATLSAFLSTIAHEMRSPITVIAGYAEILDAMGPDDVTVSRAVPAIAKGAKDLNAIIDELLLAARVDAGQVEVMPTAVDLGAAVTTTLQRLDGRVELADAKVTVEMQSAEAGALADSHLVDRILDNLINNALNYGGDSPRIDLIVGTDADEAWVRVCDHGPGIPAEMHEKIFERFVRGTTPQSRPGTGLGLYLSRGLAERLGGSLALESSAPGAGSVFILRLPRADATTAGGAGNLTAAG